MRHFYSPTGQVTLWLDNTHYSCKHTHTVFILSGHIFTHIHTTTLCAPVIPFTNYLHIPVSSAPVERLFSVAGILATCEGCCISHKLLEELISIKYNQFILNQIKTSQQQQIYLYIFILISIVDTAVNASCTHKHIYLQKHVHTYIQYNHPPTHTYTHHTYCTVSLLFSLLVSYLFCC